VIQELALCRPGLLRMKRSDPIRSGSMLYGDPTAERFRSEVRDGMRIEWDVPIRMEDGVVLRADVFRPVKEGRYPIIMTHGPYAK